LNREKFHPVPREIFNHRNKILEILREIEDYMEDEVRRDLTDGNLDGKRNPKLNYLPDEPTPYHVIPKNTQNKGSKKKFREQVGDYEGRGWTNVLTKERKTPRKN
jgi:hypothetical protein